MMEAVLPILLQHPSICEDQQIAINLLQVCKGMHAAIAGLVPLRFGLATKQQHSSTFAAWIKKHHSLVKTLQLDLGPAQPSDAAGPLAEAASTITAALQQLKSTAGLHLVSYSSPMQSQGAAALVRQLPSSHLTSLTLSVHGPHTRVGPTSLAALAHLKGLRSLDISWACDYWRRLGMSGTDTRKDWTDSITAVIPHLTQLTSLQLKDVSRRDVVRVRCEDVAACLPKTVQQLELDFFEERYLDDQGRAVLYSSGEEVQAATGHPLQLSHLAALTRLSCSRLPVAAGDVLPPNLQQLHFWKCFHPSALMGLQQLQVLGFEASYVKASQLVQLSNLTQLTEISLAYMGSEVHDEHGVDWEELWAAAGEEQVPIAWTKLPALRELSFLPLECTRSPMSDAMMQQLAQLQGLMRLKIDCSVFDMQQFATIVLAQLTRLTELYLYCYEYDDEEYRFGRRVREFSSGEVAIMQAISKLPRLADLTLSFVADGFQTMFDLPKFWQAYGAWDGFEGYNCSGSGSGSEDVGADGSGEGASDDPWSHGWEGSDDDLQSSDDSAGGAESG